MMVASAELIGVPMKVPAKLILSSLFSLLIPLATFGATADAAIVFSGRTEVNMRAYNWIREVFQANNIKYTLAPTLDPSSIKPGQYRTVVVVNTGTTSGLDPVLRRFISGFSDKRALYLVNLFRDTGDLRVTTFSADSGADGVDGVSAASTWRSAWLGGKDVQNMHLAWVKDLVRFLGRA
jgi:hypothetical protein